MPDLVLAIDQGTTSSRATLFDYTGRTRAHARRPILQQYPHPGWVNQDAEQIWRATIDAAREALAGSDVRPAEVAALGLCNQTETSTSGSGTPAAPCGLPSPGRAGRPHRSLRRCFVVASRIGTNG